MPTESTPVCPIPSGTSAPLRVPPSGSYGWTLPKVPAPFKDILSGAFHLQQQLSGTPLGDLSTIGARTGGVRTVPLRVFDDGPDAWLVVASQGWTARHPAWLHNLAARPDQLWLRVNGVDHSVRPPRARGGRAGCRLAARRLAGVQLRWVSGAHRLLDGVGVVGASRLLPAVPGRRSRRVPQLPRLVQPLHHVGGYRARIRKLRRRHGVPMDSP